MATKKAATKKQGENGAKPQRLSNADVAFLSEIVDRLHFARTHGLQYNDERDIYKVAGYPTAISFNQYVGMYERDPIGGRIVDMPAETTWRKHPEVTETDEPEDGTEFSKAWMDLAKRLKVWRTFEAADKLARVGEYGVLLIGTKGTDDSQLAQPLRNVGSPDGVIYLSAFSQKYAMIDTWNDDPTTPRYGQPETYEIDTAGDVANFRRKGNAATPKLKVHWTRVIHIAEDALQSSVIGRPALKRVYNDLQDYLKVSASTGEAFWQQVAGMLVAKLDKDAAWDKPDLETLNEVLQEIFHDLRNVLTIQGGEVERIASQGIDPGPASKLYERRISAGCGIPARMLFGSETGERASSEDQKSYFGMIGERQVTHAEPVILRAFIDRLIEVRALPRPTKNEYEVAWPPLFQESEKDTAEANKARAETAKALTPLGGDVMDIIEIDEDRNVWLLPKGAEDESPFADVLPPALPGAVPGAPPPATPEEDETGDDEQ